MYEQSHATTTGKVAAEADAFCDNLLTFLPNLNAFAISLCGNRDTAKDLAQETVLKALEKQSSFHTGADIRPWLFTILRNTYYSQRRKLGRETHYNADYHEAIDAIAPGQFWRLEIADFEKALKSLPPNQREALLLVLVEGFSYEEAARICGCVIGTVKSRLSRARTRLTAALCGEPEPASIKTGYPLASNAARPGENVQRQA